MHSNAGIKAIYILVIPRAVEEVESGKNRLYQRKPCLSLNLLELALKTVRTKTAVTRRRHQTYKI